MELKDNFLKVVKDNYANFDGRARRKEYWQFVLAYFVAYLALYVVAFILTKISGALGGLVFGIIGLASLGLLIPNIAVGVRRLHDTNKSGWFLLLAFIPLANLYLLYLMIIEGDKGPNQYGEDPKAAENGGNPFPTNNNPFGHVTSNNPFGNSNNEPQNPNV